MFEAGKNYRHHCQTEDFHHSTVNADLNSEWWQQIWKSVLWSIVLLNLWANRDSCVQSTICCHTTPTAGSVPAELLGWGRDWFWYSDSNLAFIRNHLKMFWPSHSRVRWACTLYHLLPDGRDAIFIPPAPMPPFFLLRQYCSSGLPEDPQNKLVLKDEFWLANIYWVLVPCQELHFTCIISFKLHNSKEGGIIIFNLYQRKLRRYWWNYPSSWS